MCRVLRHRQMDAIIDQPYRTLLEDYYIYRNTGNKLHQIIVFQLSKHLLEQKYIFASFEKSKSLLIAQIAIEQSKIVENLQRRKRRNYMTKYTAELIKGHLYMAELEIPVVWNIIMNWDIRNNIDATNYRINLIS